MSNYNDTFEPSVSYYDQFPGVEFTEVLSPNALLKIRREQLKFTQQQVADSAGITLRQYQKFESGERSIRGASLRIGLGICDALELDPHRFS